MDYQALKALIETHPSYPTVSDTDLLDWGNDPLGVTRPRAVVSARQLYEVMDPGKFADTAGVQWWAEHLNVNGGLEVTEVIDGVRQPTLLRTAFRNALKSANQAELDALIPEQVSRFDAAGLGNVRLGDIEYARTI